MLVFVLVRLAVRDWLGTVTAKTGSKEKLPTLMLEKVHTWDMMACWLVTEVTA